MEKNIKVILAEDDENLGLLLREYLIAKGYDTDLYPDGEAAYKGFQKNQYDLCIFDVMMPKKDGFTLAKEIRLVNTEIPIIFLTAKNMKDDVIEGFKLGGDDYMTKPFSMEELIFRIEAILRRIGGDFGAVQSQCRTGRSRRPARHSHAEKNGGREAQKPARRFDQRLGHRRGRRRQAQRRRNALADCFRFSRRPRFHPRPYPVRGQWHGATPQRLERSAGKARAAAKRHARMLPLGCMGA